MTHLHHYQRSQRQDHVIGTLPGVSDPTPEWPFLTLAKGTRSVSPSLCKVRPSESRDPAADVQQSSLQSGVEEGSS